MAIYRYEMFLLNSGANEFNLRNILKAKQFKYVLNRFKLKLKIEYIYNFSSLENFFFFSPMYEVI